MPSKTAIEVADRGPSLVIWAFIVPGLLWAGLALAFGPFLSTTTRTLYGLCFMFAVSVAFTYQGVFMLLFPETAVRHEIRPPVSVQQRRLGMHEWVTPNSALGARVIGVFGLLGAAFGFAWSYVIVVWYL